MHVSHVTHSRRSLEPHTYIRVFPTTHAYHIVSTPDTTSRCFGVPLANMTVTNRCNKKHTVVHTCSAISRSAANDVFFDRKPYYHYYVILLSIKGGPSTIRQDEKTNQPTEATKITTLKTLKLKASSQSLLPSFVIPIRP